MAERTMRLSRKGRHPSARMAPIYDMLDSTMPGQSFKVPDPDCPTIAKCLITKYIRAYLRRHFTEINFYTFHMPGGYLGVSCNKKKEIPND